MKHYYRCMKCRSRNVFNRPVEAYKIQRKCKACGWWRFYLDKERTNRMDYCRCEGWHHTHRFKSTFCIHHPARQLIERIRAGEAEAEVRLDMAFDAPFEAAPIEAPF